MIREWLLIFCISIGVGFSTMLVASAAYGPPKIDGSLFNDNAGVSVPSFIPDPAKSQVNASMTGTITFKKGTGGTVNVTGWLAMQVDPTADATYYFNTDSTKTYPLRAGSDNFIWIGQLQANEYVTLVLGEATASIQGMKGR